MNTAIAQTSSHLLAPYIARCSTTACGESGCSSWSSLQPVIAHISRAAPLSIARDGHIPALDRRRVASTLHHSRRTSGRVYCSSSATADKDELLKDAAKSGDLATVKELVESGDVDINKCSPLRAGWAALHLGAYYGHSDVTRFLLEKGADTEVRNNSGNSPLQLACLKGEVDIARLLLDAGADIDATSNDKGTAIDYAQEWGGEDMVDFLLLWAAKQSYNL